MDKNDKLSAKDLLAAMQEKNITARQVAAELNLLLHDYYTCCSSQRGDGVVIHFLNGQSFMLSVNKI
ncbi:MAG: hypothetical protein K2O41_00130 [Clostridia bacterium]|nr:hypothetical protein [Clostridia bacterium]